MPPIATLVQLGPAQDLTRAISSPFCANTNTCPSDACATNRRPALSIVRPSGPLAPKVEQKRPTLETLPSFIKGKRQTALSRVIATNNTVSVGSSTRPLGLIFRPLGQPSYSTASDHLPSGAIRKMRPNGISTT